MRGTCAEAPQATGRFFFRNVIRNVLMRNETQTAVEGLPRQTFQISRRETSDKHKVSSLLAKTSNFVVQRSFTHMPFASSMPDLIVPESFPAPLAKALVRDGEHAWRTTHAFFEAVKRDAPPHVEVYDIGANRSRAGGPDRLCRFSGTRLCRFSPTPCAHRHTDPHDATTRGRGRAAPGAVKAQAGSIKRL